MHGPVWSYQRQSTYPRRDQAEGKRFSNRPRSVTESNVTKTLAPRPCYLVLGTQTLNLVIEY